MRKTKKILDITESSVALIGDTSVAINIDNIRHSPVHCHESYIEIVYCLEGSVNILCNQETAFLHQDEIFTIGFDDLHCIYSDEPNMIISMHIDMKKMDIPWDTLKYTYFACESISCEPYQVQPLQKIKDYIIASAYSYIKYGTLDKDTADLMCHDILELMISYFDWYNHINLSPENNNELRQRFREIMRICSTNYMNKITIPQLAAEVHINENYFSQFIRKSSYKSFSNMIGYLRCFHAQYMLLNTEMSVVQISNKCGFSDIKYFYKNFRRFWGKTPTEHRKWFAEYIKTPDDVYHYDRNELLSRIEPFIADYFMKNVFSPL